jgi:hypothetical protein
VLRARPERSFRIGTGELADSLALDPLTGLSRHLVPFFAARANATLELKTKTDNVGELLDLDPRGRVVVSWSVNAPAIVAAEEHGTASLAERLSAARRVQEAGYRLGFHFDPWSTRRLGGATAHHRGARHLDAPHRLGESGSLRLTSRRGDSGAAVFATCSANRSCATARSVSGAGAFAMLHWRRKPTATCPYIWAAAV